MCHRCCFDTNVFENAPHKAAMELVFHRLTRVVASPAIPMLIIEAQWITRVNNTMIARAFLLITFIHFSIVKLHPLTVFSNVHAPNTPLVHVSERTPFRELVTSHHHVLEVAHLVGHALPACKHESLHLSRSGPCLARKEGPAKMGLQQRKTMTENHTCPHKIHNIIMMSA